MLLRLSYRARLRDERAEAEKLHRLDSAEKDLADLKRRAAKANKTLDDRQSRNHWREAIEQLIRQEA